ncbi:hypothetical protein CTRI78_v006478 [Colletotrichum trifolii]|uniref:Uncharacterized protein n=1 Tax=Colletotrichum trifolii TaxID=5466 RepID=A0A4V3HVZ0_COLTR|nr:hypothetical protein CTRI78_v006478 [Colletotrichum trifolii]
MAEAEERKAAYDLGSHRNSLRTESEASQRKSGNKGGVARDANRIRGKDLNRTRLEPIDDAERLGELMNKVFSHFAFPLLLLHAQCYSIMMRIRDFSPTIVLQILQAYLMDPVRALEMMQVIGKIFDLATTRPIKLLDSLLRKVPDDEVKGFERAFEDEFQDRGEWKESELAAWYYLVMGFPIVEESELDDDNGEPERESGGEDEAEEQGDTESTVRIR